MKKLLITDFKKINLYGDLELLSETHTRRAFIGKVIKVKILGLFWVDYNWYFKK